MPEDDNKLHEGQENGEIQEIADQISENLTGEGGEAPENPETETPDKDGENGGTEEPNPEPNPTPTPEPNGDGEEETEDAEEEQEVLGKKLTNEQIEEIRQYLKKTPESKEEALETIEQMVKLCIANQGCVISSGLYEYNTWEAISKDILWWCDKATRFNVSYPLETMLVGYLINNKAVIGY